MTIEKTGQRVRVYLDQTRLEDGQRWDAGFMNGLAHSWVFVPIVSAGIDTRAKPVQIFNHNRAMKSSN